VIAKHHRSSIKLSAVLLAGGKSRRMGQDKAAIIFRGKPLWQTQLDLLRSLEPQEILVSAQADPTWRPLDVRFVPDNSPSRGPLGGLCASLAEIRSSHLIVLAIDMPFMNEKFLRSLSHNIQPGCGALPMIENRAEPLAAIYPVQVHPDLVAALSGTDFSLQAVTTKLVAAGKLKVIHVANEEEIFFRNLNEPADLGESIGHR